MNAQQRKDLAAKLAQVAKYLEAIKAVGIDLDTLGDEVSSMQEEEEEKYNNLSEGLQQSERGQNLEQAASTLGDLSDLITDACSVYDNLMEKLEEISAHDIP
jgi:hypothetical protein